MITNVDRLLDFVRKEGRTTVAIAAKALNAQESQIEKIANYLMEENVIAIDYTLRDIFLMTPEAMDTHKKGKIANAEQPVASQVPMQAEQKTPGFKLNELKGKQMPNQRQMPQKSMQLPDFAQNQLPEKKGFFARIAEKNKEKREEQERIKAEEMLSRNIAAIQVKQPIVPAIKPIKRVDHIKQAIEPMPKPKPIIVRNAQQSQRQIPAQKPAPEVQQERKPGFFGRMFEKKRKEEEELDKEIAKLFAEKPAKPLAQSKSSGNSKSSKNKKR